MPLTHPGACASPRVIADGKGTAMFSTKHTYRHPDDRGRGVGCLAWAPSVTTRKTGPKWWCGRSRPSRVGVMALILLVEWKVVVLPGGRMNDARQCDPG